MPRIAVVQHPPAFLDRARTLARAVDLLDEAAAAGAQVVVFPEAFVPGYPAWMWRLRPGADMALTEKLHAKLRANAVSLETGELAPLREARGILYAEIDLERVGMARRSLDVVGHYARPDLFQLRVQSAPQRPVYFEHAA